MTMSNIARYPHCIFSNQFIEPEASHQLKDGYLVPYNPTIGPYYPSEKTLSCTIDPFEPKCGHKVLANVSTP
jgi:hypothetical protein